MIRIESHPTMKQLFKAIWGYRELGYFLCWRDILVRYKQTLIGIAWVILQPMIMLTIFSLVFSRFVPIPTNGIPYPLIVLSGLLVWQFFSTSLNEASQSLVTNASVIKKVYFPKLLLVISAILLSTIDLLFVILLFFGMLFYYKIPLTMAIVLFPFAILIAMMTVLGLGSLFAALNARYRDFRYLIPIALQVGMFVSPVIYPSTIISAKNKIWFFLNPMAGAIEFSRAALLGGEYSLYVQGCILSAIVAFTVMIIGILFFLTQERTFADEL